MARVVTRGAKRTEFEFNLLKILLQILELFVVNGKLVDVFG